ncbi:MAG TPA: hypothetical protein VNO55_24185 [Polyangia bacterium]|nr:hypothetical protein [Polyangia bacterium]
MRQTGPRHLCLWAALVLTAATATLPARPARATGRPAPLSLAIVVGSNRGPSASQENLRYGDDDAIQSARMLTLLGTQTTLLVDPDAETRELFPGERPDGPATQAAMKSAFGRAAEKISAARAAGRPSRLYFFFAGHGDLADGRPFLQLEDGRLWREDLAELLRAANADDNHVLVDACYAASFVADRGPGGQRNRMAPGFSHSTGDIWPDHIGFLTARSAGGQTHEWAEFQAGIFSHEVRSGLIGAADVNRDGRVTYREIAAFVQRANEAIPNRRYRPEVSTAPPDGDLDTVLADLPEGPLVLEMDLKPAGHTFVETARGVRLADLHPETGTAVWLRLPTDQGPLFVQQVTTDVVAGAPGAAAATGHQSREYQVTPNPGRMRLSALASAKPHVRARGAAHEAFLMLFSHPFDAAAVNGFRLPPDGDGEQDVPPPLSERAQRRHRLGKVALEIGVLGAALAGGCYGAATLIKGSDSHADSQTTTTGRNSWIRGLNVATWTLAGVAGASLATGAILFLWPDRPEPPVTATALPGGGAVVGYRGTF